MSWRACLGNSAQFECLPPPATTLAEDAGGIRMPASSTTNIQGGTKTASSRHTATEMRALFVGGTVDSSDMDIDGDEPPLDYPTQTGSGQPRYRLNHVGHHGGRTIYKAYSWPVQGAAEGSP